MTNIQKSINSLLSEDSVKKRFQEILGQKAKGFISSVISATKSNEMLSQAEPNSVLSAAVVAASLDLPIDGNLGFAAIVPYRSKDGKIVAQFQMMYKGFVQLAMRTGQYETINACEIYEGEIEGFNRITGEFKFTPENKKAGAKICGYVAYMRLINGFNKTLYMPIEEIEKHGKRFSQSYKKGYGLWKDDFDSMAIKTVLKKLLSKYGILSIEMGKAVKFDQSIVSDMTEDAEAEYIDNKPTIEIENASAKAVKTELFEGDGTKK